MSGHYCWVCKRYRANNQFSRKGHARRVCRQCDRRPASEIEQIGLIDHMSGFLRQSIISRKNIEQLRKLCSDSRPEVQCRARVMLEVARLRPGKRRRLKYLAQNHPQLLDEVIRLFDVPDYYFEPISHEFSEDIGGSDVIPSTGGMDVEEETAASERVCDLPF